MEVRPAWTFVRQRRYLALRTGVAAAAASVGPSFARGLLPRSTTDQAILTGAAAAYWLGFASLGLSTVEAVSELIVKSRRAGSAEEATLAAFAVVGIAGAAVVALVPDTNDVPLPVATAQSVAWVTTGGAIAGALLIGSDRMMQATVGERGLPTNLAIAAGLGAGTSAIRVGLRNRRARRHDQGRTPDRRPVAVEQSPEKVLRSVGVGAATAGGLVALAGTQFALAEGATALASSALRRTSDPVTPLVGHATAAGVLAVVGGVALNHLRRRVEHADDVVEPAYPEPPTSPHVTAGPNSRVTFDAIGK
ncbi:MAG: hypothetical protein WCF04_02555, partial [Candidatus Nanopelagicales bacterium]